MAKLGAKGSKNKKRKKREVKDKTQFIEVTQRYEYDPNAPKQETEPTRASKSSYVLICGTRTPIQDLSHESLCDRYTLVTNEVSNLRRELNNLQELESNLRLEKFYRNL